MTGGRLHDAVHRHRLATDIALALVVLTGVLIASAKDQEGWATGHQTPPVIVLEALVLLSLTVRRTWPVPVLACTVAGSVAVMLLVKGWAPVAIAVVLAMLTVAMRADRRTTIRIAVVVGVALVIGGCLRSGGWVSTETVSVLAWTGFASALGQAIQSQKAYVAAVEERARRAEQSREEEAGRRVIEERLRIARELHDVVAHHIAVIQVQSGVVDHLLTERPEAAREALGHVRRSSRTVLDELGGLLGVLRQPDDPITPTDPAPGLDRLAALIDAFSASGLQVDWRLTGEAQSLPAAVDLVAYRLVQEGLTNAHKHGTGSADMVLAFEADGLTIDIVNLGAGPAGVGPGHGLAGMRERAHAVGGVVSAAPQQDGTWRLTARLPLAGDAGRALPLWCRWKP